MEDHPENKSNSSDFLKTDRGKTRSNAIEVPSISLPKGGGAIKSIDEKFSVNAVNGTASFSIPLPFSAARGASPALSLSYNSGSGNSVFGLGWKLGGASIKRKTDNELPQYIDGSDSDIFLFSEAEDLVPEFKKENDGSFSIDTNGDYIFKEKDSPDGLYLIRFYRPRIEGSFARIERWTEKSSGRIKWRVITKDNQTTLFGWSSDSVIHDPNDDNKIFQWLPEFFFDDKGNCIHYIYKKEDEVGLAISLLHNKNRFKNGAITYTNLYLEKVLYGNRTPYKKFGDPFPGAADYLFQTIFDYGEYNPDPPYSKIKEWDFRHDPYSDYKPGFEIRTTRLCRRILLFHFFNELPGESALVKSINIDYDTVSEKSFTFLKSVTTYGYIKKTDGSYSSKKLPAFEFGYQKHEWNKEVKQLDPGALVHSPSGFDGQQYQFTDLFNEGLSGILTEQANGWYYKHNLGEGNFDQAKLVTPKPSFIGLGGQLQLADLDADGTKQLINYSIEPKGYFELDDDNQWRPFKNFNNLPNLDFSDANARMLDLNGDGKPDLVITEDNVITWYDSKGRDGFHEMRRSVKFFDEELGMKVLFSDKEQSIFLADMSGDGMTDVVRIRNGEICYWPNMGYGKFGNKIAMDNAPLFDHPTSFDPTFIRLADIDGSGTTDIIYLGKNKFSCWLNLSGNGFATSAFEIDAFPEVHGRANITVTDLMGNGVGCIVWSGGLSKDSGFPLKYVDLMNSKKPHLMILYKNNLGKEVSLEYAASTRFYIEDKLSGAPWITKLHFPVHCISKTETHDKISGWHFTSSYKYHHGYYDHVEKEFRGFGMVEQADTEHFEHWEKGNASNIIDKELHQEPVITKTWFHTGAFLQKEKILSQFAGEYWYQEMKKQGIAVVHHEISLPDASIIGATGIPDTVIDHLSTREWLEALRACKGMALRSEIFAHDAPLTGATPDEIKKQLTPYSVSTHNCVIELLQPRGKNKHAVFIVKESEAITYSYERDPADPRVAHNLNIKLDELGNVLESAAVVYPRLFADSSLPPETQQGQSKPIIIYTQNQFTNDINSDEAYRLRLSSETKTFELKGVFKATPFYILSDFEEVLSDTNSEIANYHELEKPLPVGKAQRRLIEHVRSIYYGNNLTGALPLHQLESLALSFENYQLAYTPELINDIFGTKANAGLMTEGKFTHSEGDNNWWIRSGSTQFINGAETSLAAQDRFYVPISYTDPYEAVTKIKYYAPYFLFIEETEDMLGNKAGVETFNFRTLSPQKIRDINGNFSEAISDELGLVKAVAVMGKGNEADELTGLSEFTDPPETVLIQNFFNSSDSVQLTTLGKTLLQRATTFFIYNLDAYVNTGKAAVVAAINREEHFHQNSDSPVQIAFEYSNGLGEVVMKKAQAEPGVAKQVIVHVDDTVTVNEIDTKASIPTQLRWLGTGRTIKNNKGNVVKQYEPYFSVTPNYEDFRELTETGVTPLMFYDALGRLRKTQMADGTFSKVEFDSWKQMVYDANDTIIYTDWYHNRINNLIDAQLLAEGKDPAKEKLAAAKAAKHADTPAALHFDTLNRPVLSVEHNKDIATEADEFYNTRSRLDAEGNLRTVTDARNNIVVQYKYDMLGNLVYQNSMDSGQRWMLLNVLGKPLRTWDERNHEFQYFYDLLQRPAISKILGGDGTIPLDHIFGRVIYGESLLLPDRSNEAALQVNNILGKPIQQFDTGGLIDIPKYDFKTKPVTTTRKLFRKYKEVANWTDANLTADLETEAFTFITEMDALGRIIRQVTPDGSIITPAYGEGGLLNEETVLHAGATTPTLYIKDIDYNEKGQREKIIYGNDVTTRFYYDKQTFRLKRLETKRQNNDPLQDWYYTHDPSGNITHIEDKNIPEVFFNNQKTTGISEYTYDALYRLVEAKGRENDAALNFTARDNWNDVPFLHQLTPGDAMTVRPYTQHYHYDAAGNIVQMQHFATGNNWSRDYTYQANNNRLLITQVGSDIYDYLYHPQHGFITAMPHLEELGWNFKEELVRTISQRRTDGGTPETTYYQYDGSGQRIRKITEDQADPGLTPSKKEERIYITGYELYKKHSGVHAGLERVSLSLLDEGHRFVMVETRNNVNDDTEQQLVRYQLHNHLGSAAMELNDEAEVISYEEYHPYGTTAYQAKNKDIKSAGKRYRYTDMERDEETGLEYHSARYYLPWLGRWLSPDPVGLTAGLNVYLYGHNNPIGRTDKSGKDDNDDAAGIGYRPRVSLGDFTFQLDPEVQATMMAMGIIPGIPQVSSFSSAPTAFTFPATPLVPTIAPIFPAPPPLLPTLIPFPAPAPPPPSTAPLGIPSPLQYGLQVAAAYRAATNQPEPPGYQVTGSENIGPAIGQAWGIVFDRNPELKETGKVVGLNALREHAGLVVLTGFAGLGLLAGSAASGNLEPTATSLELVTRLFPGAPTVAGEDLMGEFTTPPGQLLLMRSILRAPAEIGNFAIGTAESVPIGAQNPEATYLALPLVLSYTFQRDPNASFLPRATVTGLVDWRYGVEENDFSLRLMTGFGVNIYSRQVGGQVLSIDAGPNAQVLYSNGTWQVVPGGAAQITISVP